MGFAIAEQGCLYIRTRRQAVWKAVITAGKTLGGPDFRPCWMRFNATGSRVRIAVQVRMTVGGHGVVRRFRFHPYPSPTCTQIRPRRVLGDLNPNRAGILQAQVAACRQRKRADDHPRFDIYDLNIMLVGRIDTTDPGSLRRWRAEQPVRLGLGNHNGRARVLQTRKDSTVGRPEELGRRGARAADTVAEAR